MVIAMIKPTMQAVSMMVEIVVVLASIQTIVQHVSALVTSQLVMEFPTLWQVIMESPMDCLPMVFAMMNSTPLNVALMVLIVVVPMFSVIIVLNVLAMVILMCSRLPGLILEIFFQTNKKPLKVSFKKSKCN